MEGKNLGILITAFIMVLIGVALIGTTASETTKRTTLTNVAGETIKITRTANGNVTEGVVYTVTNAPTTWRQADCPLTNFAVKNASGTTLTVTTDYVPTLSAGTFTIKNTTATNNFAGFFNGANNYSYVSYTYCPDDYLTQSWQRTILNLVPGFFAIAIMLIGVGLMFLVLKNEGLLNL